MLRQAMVGLFALALCVLAAGVALAYPCYVVSIDPDGKAFTDPALRGTVDCCGYEFAFETQPARPFPSLIWEVIWEWWPPPRAVETSQISFGLWGVPPNRHSIEPVISGLGDVVAYTTFASDTSPDDTNNAMDVIVRWPPNPSDPNFEPNERVSSNDAGEPGDGNSFSPSIDVWGDAVAFASEATNLVPGDTNWVTDIFVRDLLYETTERVSVSSTGAQANGASNDPSISGDGQCVAFTSAATNLVPGDTNLVTDIFVRDWVMGTTERVSVSTWGEQANAGSWAPDISGDGRWVAFVSAASNLVPNDRNGQPDIFLYDRASHTTQRINMLPGGQESMGPAGNPAVNFDGSFVAFETRAPDVGPFWMHTYGMQNIYRWDAWTGELEPISWGVTSSTVEDADADCVLPDINADGGGVVFQSTASNLDPAGKKDVPSVYAYADWGGCPATFWDVSCWFWAYDEIEACAAQYIVAGYPDGSYRPYLQVTRDQMAVFLARAICGNDTLVPQGPATASFTDVPTSYWAYNHIEFLKAYHVVTGYGDPPSLTYDPTGKVDRGGMSVFVAASMAGGREYVPPGPDTPDFPDVSPDGPWAWCYDYVEYIYAKGVAQGIDGLYHPEYLVTRDQMAVYVYRAFLR
jgi:Tol biopolymer transport system component